MKKAILTKQILLLNTISLIIILVIQASSPEIGRYMLSTKIEFINEDILYWFARYIETTAVNNICLIIGLLNISLITLAIHHVLSSKKE